MTLWHTLISTFVLVLIALGLKFRHDRTRHIPLMLAAFLIDFGLVLSIELKRHAVEKLVLQQVPMFTVVHALISLGVLGLYVALMVFGFKIIKDQPNARGIHKKLGIAFVVMRLLNFATSLMLPMFAS